MVRSQRGLRWNRRVLARLQRELDCATWRATTIEERELLQLTTHTVRLAYAGVSDPARAAAQIIWPDTPWPAPPPVVPMCAVRMEDLAREVDGRTGEQWAGAILDYLRFRAGQSWRNWQQRKDPGMHPYVTAMWVVTQALRTPGQPLNTPAKKHQTPAPAKPASARTAIA